MSLFILNMHSKFWRKICAIFVVLFIILALIEIRGRDEWKPSFIPASSLTNCDQLTFVRYQFLIQRPFEGGKMWILAKGPDGYRNYLFDLEKHTILGCLRIAEPAFLTKDQSQVVCSIQTAQVTLRQVVRNLLSRLTKARSSNGSSKWTFWLVSLDGKSIQRLGSLDQDRFMVSSLIASPQFDRGYIKPPSMPAPTDIYLYNGEKSRIDRLHIDGEPDGWWDNNHFILRTPKHDFLLFDVVTQTTSPLLSQAQVAKAFSEAGITENPSKGTFFSSWNGRENILYFTDPNSKWMATNSYLFKLQRPDKKLVLITNNFKFGWSDSFNSSQTLYLYSGRESGEKSSGAYIRDLAANTNFTLIPDNGTKSFNIPSFYGDKVIFVRNQILWQTDLTGSNVLQLFPPPRK